jgi:gamma-glutamylcyclotransferase (GGCT)/AIG2-like uncharacterized protein YtfP
MVNANRNRIRTSRVHSISLLLINTIMIKQEPTNIAIAAYGLLIPHNEEADGTVFGYTMWNTGGFPVALERTVRPDDHPIRVKIIKVSLHGLKCCDVVESTPYMYNRLTRPVQMDNGETIKAWFYVGVKAFWMHRPLQPQIMDGDWKKFSKERYDRVMNPPVEQQ